jgi:hypothetical protein
MQYFHKVPPNVLADIFAPEVFERLASRQDPSQNLQYRLDVLTASGPVQSDPCQIERVSKLRKKRAAWDTYLTAAYAIGLFDGPSGQDLRSRLQSPDEDNFRSAISECLAAWFLAGRCRLPVEPRPIGRPRHPLELCTQHPDGEIHVEVKAPHRRVVKTVWIGDDSDLLQQALESANKQFRDDVRNLLVIVPELRISVFDHRSQITRAFFVEMTLNWLVDTATGKSVDPVFDDFKPSGHFLETRSRTGAPFKRDLSARFTRISAVLCIEEILGEQSIEHNALVLHNPNAHLHVTEELWRGLPQLVRREGQMVWTDHAGLW